MTNNQNQTKWYALIGVFLLGAVFFFFKTEDWPTAPCVIAGIACVAGVVYSGWRLSKISR